MRDFKSTVNTFFRPFHSQKARGPNPPWWPGRQSHSAPGRPAVRQLRTGQLNTKNFNNENPFKYYLISSYVLSVAKVEQYQSKDASKSCQCIIHISLKIKNWYNCFHFYNKRESFHKKIMTFWWNFMVLKFLEPIVLYEVDMEIWSLIRWRSH